MIVPSKFNGYNKDGTRNLFMGGGGGGGPTQTTSTVQNTNIPSYAQPYVESMLGATQKQLFNTSQVESGKDESGNPIYGTSLDSFKPYQAYGGTYDDKGNQLSYDPTKGIAGINDAQQRAYMGMYGMTQDPNFANAAQRANQASLDAIRTASISADYGQAGQRSGLKGQQLGIAGGERFGNLGVESGLTGQALGIAGGGKYGAMGAEIGQQATKLATPALGYGALGASYGQGAQQLIDPALTYGAQSAGIGAMGLGALGEGADVSSKAEYLAGQQAASGRNYARQATNPYAMGAYMSPYMQNVVDVQNQEAQRGADIAGNVRGAQAARAGAFGGSRQAIENAEAQRNLALIKNQNQAQGLQQAYQQAQQAQQFGANLGLQGQSAAQQGLGVSLAGTQTGLQGLGTALQGQQGALAGIGQAGNMYGLGIQGAQTGLQGVNAANAAYQTGIQGANTGLAGVNTQLAGTAQGMQGAQVGLQGVDRQLAGTAQGMQGAQVGLQGVQGAQAGYGLANQAGANVANIANQSQAAQQALYNNQMQMGNQKMAYDQSIKNQAVQDYANAQQYPLMQLGTMSNMLRGLPMQASTTNQYAASPNPLSQAIGTIGAGTSIYNATKPGGAAGGLPSEFKYAKGGIMSYDMGGEVESQLENMDEKGLQAQARESSSPSIRRMAQRLLRERQMSKPQGADAANVQYQAAQPQMPSYAPGGIIAFKTGGGANEEGGEDEAKIGMQQRLDQPAPTTGGIMGATTQPTTPVPVAPAKPLPDIAQEAMRQRDIYSAQAARPTTELLKDIQAERDALGVGENVGRQEFRAQQMAERANMKDEQERQRHMRLAEFFASWGSTPGPVLVAGMNALKQSIPNIISDEKEAKKARKEADKIIYDIDEATRLEKLGMIDKATALKEKAASHAEDYNKYLLSLQGQREANVKALEVANIGLEGQKYVADSHAAAQRGANAQRAEEMKMRNIENSLEISRRRLMDVEKDIDATRNKPPKGTPLAKAMESVNRYNNILEKNDGDASKVDAYIKKDAEQAKAIVDRFEESAKRRLKDARDQVQIYENIFTTQGRGSKPGATTPTNKADPYDIMDILKSEPSASAASANAPTGGTTKLANKPTKTTAEVPTNLLASNPYRETGRGKTGVDQGALQRDLQEYNELKDSKLSVAAGRKSFLEKKLRAAGALED